MDTRVAILAIIAHDNGSAQEINAILHEHAEYIICLLYTSDAADE
mgnify:CR=1 FL=1